MLRCELTDEWQLETSVNQPGYTTAAARTRWSVRTMAREVGISPDSCSDLAG